MQSSKAVKDLPAGQFPVGWCMISYMVEHTHIKLHMPLSAVVQEPKYVYRKCVAAVT